MSEFKIKRIGDTDYIKGVFSITDRPNRNGITISAEAMRSAIEEFGKAEMFGTIERDYKFPTIDLSLISHKITDIFESVDGNVFIAESKILNTPKGEHLKKLLDMNTEMEYNGYYNAELFKDKTVKNLNIISVDIMLIEKPSWW